jgi:adenosyl cobinamide kinase/adenosyl cobinamide phosphate guanylyltransferase
LLKAKANREKIVFLWVTTGRSMRLTQRRQEHDDKAGKHWNTVANPREEEEEEEERGSYKLVV